MRFGALLIAVLLGGSTVGAAAQVVIRPERQPARVAGQEAWYRAGEPLMYRGELFYPGGAQVFFEPNVMVLAAEYRGVPLYVIPTEETGSYVYLPIGNGLMQPYERIRSGDLAGTSGSRAPSFTSPPPAAAADPTLAVGTTGVAPPAPPVGDTPLVAAARAAAAPSTPVVTIAPSGTSRGRGIWIEYDGRSWRAAGGAVRVGPQFVQIGTFNGRNVYRGPDGATTIWIETAQGLATPWRR